MAHTALTAQLRHLLVVADLERSIVYYTSKLQATVLVRWEGYARLELFGNTFHLIDPGGPTPDKPDVWYAAPDSPQRVTHEVILEVADCRALYKELLALGVDFMSEPTVPPWGDEIRCFFRDPDGHLFELTQPLP